MNPLRDAMVKATTAFAQFADAFRHAIARENAQAALERLRAR